MQLLEAMASIIENTSSPKGKKLIKGCKVV
jgi:hypothetical protein